MRDWCLTCAAGVILLQWGKYIHAAEKLWSAYGEKIFLDFWIVL